MRLQDPASGRILVDGRDVREVSRASVRRQLGVVFQDNVLFQGTIAQNIAIATPEASRQQITVAAKAANIHRFIRSLLQGYQRCG